MTKPNDLNRARRKSLFVILLALLLVPEIGFSKTITRSCKGAEMIQYEINGKKYTHTEPFRYKGTSKSKGVVPSPNKARERACKLAAQQASRSANQNKLLNKVCAKHPNSRGRVLFVGGTGSSKGVKKTHRASASSLSREFQCKNSRLYHRPICGNGKKEGVEDCDNGNKNSDTISNACRTDCTLADCGDGVTDSGEECDEGSRNHDEIPGACRTYCKLPYCGDGVLDYKIGEKCDDGNNNPNDGCYQCKEE